MDHKAESPISRIPKRPNDEACLEYYSKNFYIIKSWFASIKAKIAKKKTIFHTNLDWSRHQLVITSAAINVLKLLSPKTFHVGYKKHQSFSYVSECLLVSTKVNILRGNCITWISVSLKRYKSHHLCFYENLIIKIFGVHIRKIFAIIWQSFMIDGVTYTLSEILKCKL